MLPWDGSLQNCVESLEISEEAVPSDVVLCQWAKLQIVADQVALQIQHSSERGQYGAEIQVEAFPHRLDRLRIRFSEKQISCKSTENRCFPVSIQQSNNLSFLSAFGTCLFCCQTSNPRVSYATAV